MVKCWVYNHENLGLNPGDGMRAPVAGMSSSLYS